MQQTEHLLFLSHNHTAYHGVRLPSLASTSDHCSDRH